MLSLKGSWSGRTFALARCSDSPEKKTRRRLSKEERKTMVDSFIKKYQDSNNGTFPSLNLTHKEVGGSFYTVREIVREIIQENKVLGPGNPTSRGLNLEDYLEEYPVGSLSMEPHAIDNDQKKCFSLDSEHQLRSEESYEITISDPLHLLDFHPNGKSFSINGTSSELGVGEYETGNKRNSVAGSTDSYENNDAYETGEEVFQGTTTLLSSGNDDTPSPFLECSASSTREVSSLASITAKICDSDESYIEAKGITISTAEIGCHTFPHEKEAVSVEADKEPATKRIKPTENLSPSLIGEAEAMRLPSPLSLTSESIKHEPHNVVIPSNKDNIDIAIESYFCESPPPNAKGASADPVKAEYEDITSKREGESVINSKSGEATAEVEKEETNPVWAAVQAFVAAVIKFWTE